MRDTLQHTRSARPATDAVAHAGPHGGEQVRERAAEHAGPARRTAFAHANLLPITFRRRVLIRQRLRQWIPAWLLAVGVAATLALSDQRELHDLREQLAVLEEQTAPLAAIVAENRQIQTRLNELAGRQSLLGMLEPKLQPVQVLGLVSCCARRDEPRVQVRSLALGPAPGAPPPERGGSRPQPQAPPPAPPLRLDLSGVATDDLAIAEFVAALRAGGVFHKVELRSTGGARTDRARQLANELPLREYLIECVFHGDDEP